MSSISVLTPSYNYARFIEDCLDSVARQQAAGVQHVVADGSSTDETVALLRRRPSVDWFSEDDRGQSDALAKALARSDGDWIGWLNADEFYLPGALQAVRTAIEDDPLADVIFGDFAFVDEQGALLRLVPQHRFSELVLRWYGHLIHNSAMFFRRSLVEAAGWDAGLQKVMDWDLTLSFAAHGARFVYVPRALGAYRIHPAQVTAGLVPTTDPEKELVRRRWGIPHGRWNATITRLAGGAVHAGLKLAAGSYGRQLRARSFQGRSLRWFASEDAAAGVIRLLESSGG